MTIREAKIELSQKLADVLNESKLSYTIKRMVLAEIDVALAKGEEDAFQKALGEESDA